MELFKIGEICQCNGISYMAWSITAETEDGNYETLVRLRVYLRMGMFILMEQIRNRENIRR